jgi:hypothetical protein
MKNISKVGMIIKTFMQILNLSAALMIIVGGYYFTSKMSQATRDYIIIVMAGSSLAITILMLVSRGRE